MLPWKRRNIYKPPVLGFHASFGGCIYSFVFNPRPQMLPGHKMFFDVGDLLDAFLQIAKRMTLESPKRKHTEPGNIQN